MGLSIGNNTLGSLYLGSTKIGAAYFGNVKVYQSGPVLPSHTIRCRFKTGYTPSTGDSQTLVDASNNIWDIYKASNSWSYMFSSDASNLVEVIAANTTGVTVMSGLFYMCEIATVPLFDTSSVTNMAGMFMMCHDLTSVPLFDTSSVTDMSTMFYSCSSLASVPLFDTSSVTNMAEMFMMCHDLTSVPLFDTSSVTDMSYMFYDCSAVQSGALALYQQASGQATPPSNYASCFTNCGSNTVTGAAELAQIPSSWGGTGA